MKKFVVCLVAFAFVAAIAGVSFGRTMNEEAQAVRAYLKVIDAKLAKAKKANQSAKINLFHAEKNATLARWNKLKASMAVPPAPVTPPPITIIEPALKEVIRSGRGFSIYVHGGMDSGLTGFSGSVGYDFSGQPDEGIKLRGGINYIYGTNPENSDVMKALSVKVGAMYYLTPFFPTIGLPLTYYVGGAALYPFKVNNGRTGRWGVEALVGANYNIPELGVISLETGYGALKYDDSQPSVKGLILKIGYGLIF